MTPEQQLLDRIRRVLADADVDADDLVAEAYSSAREEVAGVLRRMMVQDLLERTLRSLGGTPVGPEADREASDPGPEHDEPAPGTAAWVRAAFEHDTDADTPPAPDAESPTAPDAVPPPTPDAVPPPTPARDDEARDHEARVGDAPTVDPAPAPGDVLTYVFGIVDDAGLDTGELARLPGGGPLRVLAVDGLAALVCDVDPATFEVLRTPGPEGLDTLTAAALAHDANLAALARRTTVLPLQLGTVVPDDDAVRRLLADNAGRMRCELDRLAGLTEWSVTVQVFGDEDDHGERARREASSGSDYLQRRSEGLDRRASRFQRREQLARTLHERLATVAVDADTVSARPVDDVAPPLLHGVYLLADEETEAFDDVVAALRGEHPEAVIDVGGPWPPYHFSAVELAAPPGAEA